MTQTRVHFGWFNLVDVSILNFEGAIMVLAVYGFPYQSRSRPVLCERLQFNLVDLVSSATTCGVDRYRLYTGIGSLQSRAYVISMVGPPVEPPDSGIVF